MQTSKPTSLRARAIITAIVALILIVAGNAVLNFIFVPYGSKSDVMWTDYYQEEHLDAVYAGTSLSERAFNPYVIDEAWGISTYNMCTPAQTLEESFNAFKTAYREHGITRAVLGVEFATFQNDTFLSPSSAFISQKWRHQNVTGTIRDWMDILSDPSYWSATNSLNFLSPWIYNHVHATPSFVVRNIKMKLDGTTLYDAAEQNEVGWIYYGKGFGTYDVSMAEKNENPTSYLEKYSRAEFSQKKLATVAKICQFCNDNGIELIVVNLPEPEAIILEYGDQYFQQSSQLKDFFAEQGVHYYDFSFMKKEYFAGTGEYFADWQHMNQEGGLAFGLAFVGVVEAAEQGEDTSQMFYQNMDEYRANVKSITRVNVDARCQDGVITVQLSSLTGSRVSVEYRVSVWDDTQGAWVEVRPYAQDTQATFKAADGDMTRVRVEARKVGSTGKPERVAKVNVYRQAD